MKAPWKPSLSPGAACTYAGILEALERDLQSGRLQPGDRLPTHRELAAALSVAVGTVTRAYREAERKGLIYGDGRRGTFVGTRAARRAGRPGFRPEAEPVDLSRFYPPATDLADLGGALARLARRRDVGSLLNYTSSEGWEHHRAAGAKWVGGLGMKAEPDQVIMTGGAQHAIMAVLLARGEKGGIIAANGHVYPGLKSAANRLGLEVVGLEADGDGILPDSLASCCKARPVRFLYTVPTFSNPTNSVLSESRRHEIAGMAGKYGFEIIEDEINRPLLAEPLPLISSIVPERSYLIAPVTKMLGGGIRICYVVAPGSARMSILKAVYMTMLMVSPILAEIASVWINDGTADRIMAETRRENKLRNQIADKILSGFEFRAWPTSYFIWLTLPGTWRVEGFAAEAQRQGVLVAPASCFALDQRREANAVRLCTGSAADHDTLRWALTALAQVLGGRSSVESIVL